MRTPSYSTAPCALAMFFAASTARADVNQVVEGEYDAACEAITISAGVFESSCESTDTSLLCSADWIGTPFQIQLPCGVGALTSRAEAVYEECLESKLLVRDQAGNTLLDATPQVCTALHDVLIGAARTVEATTNGTFTIDVATNTWISAMAGTFASENGLQLGLGYATANFPWSSAFGFAMANGIRGAVKLDDVCGGPAALTGISSGSVDKATGVLDLKYNLNGTMTCAGERAVTVTVNINVDMAGQKR